MDSRRLIIASALFAASAFVLSLKLLLPTPINIYFQQGQNSALVERVQGFYNWSDVVTVLIAAVVLGWSGAIMLSSSRNAGQAQTTAYNDVPAWKAAFEQKKSAWEVTAKMLKDDEAAVFRTIVAAEGLINQGELVTRTGLPKSTVSKCLDMLESRGLVERRRRGMGNIVHLK